MKYSDLGHAFNRNMKIMSTNKANGLIAKKFFIVVRWQLTDQAYLDETFYIIVKLHPFSNLIVLVFYVISW